MPSMSSAGMVTSHSASCCRASAGSSAAAAAAAASSIADPGSTARPLTCEDKSRCRTALDTMNLMIGLMNWQKPGFRQGCL